MQLQAVLLKETKNCVQLQCKQPFYKCGYFLLKWIELRASST